MRGKQAKGMRLATAALGAMVLALLVACRHAEPEGAGEGPRADPATGESGSIDAAEPTGGAATLAAAPPPRGVASAPCPPAFAGEFPEGQGPPRRADAGPLPPAPDDPTFCACRRPGETCGHWRTAMNNHFCGAAMAGPRTCICDECARDADCTAGPAGACLLLPTNGICPSPLAPKVCVYAGDPCHPPASCPKNQRCALDPKGRPHCFPVYMGPMPP